MIRKNLLDLNVLIALTDAEHELYRKAQKWFDSSGAKNWGVCPLTEAGFVRVTTNPTFRPGPRTLEQAIAILQGLKGHPGYRYWEIAESWVTLTSRFAARILGHQQVTDAYLLGMAIKEEAELVTFDKGLIYLAGDEFRKHVLLLE